MPTKTRTFVYKQAAFAVDGQPLEDQVLVALNGVPALNRCEEIVQGSGVFRVINSFDRRPDEGLFLTFMLFNEHQLPYAISMVGNAASFPVHVVTPAQPPDLPNTPVEIVESTSFALIRGNHVVFMNTSSLRWGKFNDHLNWLLSRNLQNIPQMPQEPGAARPPLSQLSALFDPKYEDNVELRDANIAPAGVSVDQIVLSQPLRLQEENHRRTLGGIGAGALQSLFGDRRNFLRGLTVDECAQVSRIKAQVTLTLHGDESAFLDRVGQAIRADEEDVDYVVHLSNGTKLKRNQIEITKPMKLEVIDKNFVPLQVRAQMIEWLVQVLAGM